MVPSIGQHIYSRLDWVSCRSRSELRVRIMREFGHSQTGYNLVVDPWCVLTISSLSEPRFVHCVCSSYNLKIYVNLLILLAHPVLDLIGFWFTHFGFQFTWFVFYLTIILLKVCGLRIEFFLFKPCIYSLFTFEHVC